MSLKRMQSSARSKSLSRTASRDFRVICDCQRHAIRERTLIRRTARGLKFVGHHLRRRGVALLIGIPLAFGAVGIPMDAMNLGSIPMFTTRESAVVPQPFPIFTTRKVREAFLHPEQIPRAFSLELTKEDFFRSEVPYGPIIYREAQRYRLPPELVAAVVESESDFRVRLVSEKNAQGLMQIVPETARLMGCEDVFDPGDNIAAGTKYLRYLLDRFGDQRMALAAYNAGEGNIERFGGIPPFPETQDYLRRVSVRTRMYRQRVHNRYLASLRMRPTFTQ